MENNPPTGSVQPTQVAGNLSSTIWWTPITTVSNKRGQLTYENGRLNLSFDGTVEFDVLVSEVTKVNFNYTGYVFFVVNGKKYKLAFYDTLLPLNEIGNALKSDQIASEWKSVLPESAGKNHGLASKQVSW